MCKRKTNRNRKYYRLVPLRHPERARLLYTYYIIINIICIIIIMIVIILHCGNDWPITVVFRQNERKTRVFRVTTSSFVVSERSFRNVYTVYPHK